MGRRLRNGARFGYLFRSILLRVLRRGREDSLHQARSFQRGETERRNERNEHYRGNVASHAANLPHSILQQIKPQHRQAPDKTRLPEIWICCKSSCPVTRLGNRPCFAEIGLYCGLSQSSELRRPDETVVHQLTVVSLCGFRQRVSESIRPPRASRRGRARSLCSETTGL